MLEERFDLPLPEHGRCGFAPGFLKIIYRSADRGLRRYRRGYSKDNLFWFRRFYHAYPKLTGTPKFDAAGQLCAHPEKLVFNRLSYDHQLEIPQLLLDQELDFLKRKGHPLEPSAKVLPFIVRRGFHPKLGARPMRDAVEKLVGDAVAVDILKGCAAQGELVVDEAANCLAVVGSFPRPLGK